ncbi:MAG: hypothetical protein QF922_06685 [SAR324 cluster bacterium]|nr:hypothetical protein [SAR324 cluster bacterium]
MTHHPLFKGTCKTPALSTCLEHSQDDALALIAEEMRRAARFPTNDDLCRKIEQMLR